MNIILIAITGVVAKEVDGYTMHSYSCLSCRPA